MVLKITKIIWAVICLFCAWLWGVDDFYMAFKTPKKNPFGSEGPVADFLWYEIQKAYLICGAVLIVWFFIGLMFCLFQHKIKKLKYGIIAHIIATFIYVIVIWI
jgi:hypothetical protein